MNDAAEVPDALASQSAVAQVAPQVKRDRRRSKVLAELVGTLHARHDVLETGLENAIATSRRAEQAAIRSGRS
jgi:hypothetical protein